MSSIGKIYTYPNSPRVAKSLIAAKYNQVEVAVEPNFQMGVTNKTPEFLKKFPLGKIPTFEGADGFTLFESSAIAYYVASQKEKTQLLGKDKKEAAKIQQWVAMADNEFSPIAAAWLYPIFGWGTFSEASTKKAQEDAKRVLNTLNQHLLNNTFLVGETVTLADISVVCTLVSFYKSVFDPEFRAAFKNVTRWFVTCVNQPHFKAVLGDVALATVMQKYDPSKEVEAAEPKKEASKPAAKKPAAEDEEPSFEDPKPAGKNPLDLLPKSKFNLEDWKRFYSNNATRPTALKYFWDNYDAEGFSIWKVDYKYNNELKLTFMSSNLVGGFFQRLERARKYAFGSVCILGEDNKNQISGYFVFRGQDVPFEVTDAADYDSYKFTKANIKDAKTKEAIEAYFAWDDVIEGKKFADGKVFK